MSRIARIVEEGIPFHITQRANRRQQVFFEPADDAAWEPVGLPAIVLPPPATPNGEPNTAQERRSKS